MNMITWLYFVDEEVEYQIIKKLVCGLCQLNDEPEFDPDTELKVFHSIH